MTLNAPPKAPMSSPITSTRSSRAHLLAQRRRRSPAGRSSLRHSTAPARPSREPRQPLHGAAPSPSGCGSRSANTPSRRRRRVGHRQRQRLLASPRRPRASTSARSASMSTPSSRTRALLALDRVAARPLLDAAPAARSACRRARRGRACASSRPRSASGPRRRSPARARRSVASNIASASLPSTRHAREPVARRRARPGRRANCWPVGVEYAYWLFSRTKMTGSCWTPAQFIASWKSPREVEPSPNQVIATARLAAQLERHRHARRDEHHVGQHRDHPDAADRVVAEVDVAVAPARDAARAAHVLGEDRGRASTPRTRCAPRSRCRMQRRSSAAIANAAPTDDRLLRRSRRRTSRAPCPGGRG